MSIKKIILMCLTSCLLLSNLAFTNIVSAEEKSNNQRVGAPSQKTWTFKANKKGTYKLRFSYARSWEKTIPALKTVAYTVEVK